MEHHHIGVMQEAEAIAVEEEGVEAEVVEGAEVAHESLLRPSRFQPCTALIRQRSGIEAIDMAEGRGGARPLSRVAR